MKVLLLQPPIRDFYDTEIRLQPLGLCMLKATLKKEMPHIEVVVKDYHQGHGRKTVAYPPELSYLKIYYQYPDASPFSMFHHFYHFGASYEDLARDVTLEKPDIVGISSLFSAYSCEALACARKIKHHLNVPVLMGGPHVSALPMEVLKDPNVDYIIRGEGEQPLVQFLRAMESERPMSEVPNLGFKHEGKIILNPMSNPPDITVLPWPDFSDFPVNRYLFEKKPLCFIMTSRGCPHHCTFCSVHKTFGKVFRRRTTEDIISEIKERYGQGYRVFDFEDDNLTFDRKDFYNLLLRLKTEIPLEDARFVAMNGISYMSLDYELLEMMKSIGFKSLNLSLVSANVETLLKVQRPHTVGKFLEVVRSAHDLGFDTVCYQILGLPSENLDDIIRTMTLLASLPVLIGVSIFYLVPGCAISREFYPMSREDCTRSRSTAMAVESSRVNRDDLYTLFKTARIINFLKGLPIRGKNASLKEALDNALMLGKRQKTGSKLLSNLLHDKKLYTAAGNDYIPLQRFRTNLFFRVLESMSHIRTQTGGIIDISFNLT
ncbi:MAG: B12-binding domain-containing radical SAM protein [Deltaproteobacteria bacterium]|nr:B12-binding domain-containing radical SAM protein [Deltaproteobacteria bacterium]